MNNTRVTLSEQLTKNDTLSGRRAVRNCDELIGFLRPMLVATRKMGDEEGARWLAGLIADVGVLRAGVKELLREG